LQGHHVTIARTYFARASHDHYYTYTSSLQKVANRNLNFSLVRMHLQVHHYWMGLMEGMKALYKYGNDEVNKICAGFPFIISQIE